MRELFGEYLDCLVELVVVSLFVNMFIFMINLFVF